MKNAINQLKGVAIIVMVAFLNLYPPSTQAQVGVSVSYQTFYDDLSPYGQWVSDGGYGNVWVPYTNDANFRPYCTGGHWAMTDYGNTWVSDYPWGWATFHYGRWTYDQYYG
ncbi:MAG TPA: DUF6600 domain-containing protein, partial [Flavipsychrobacter sp.]|nr:DUF6600 domain-containing protein [Flavipsychrobacter sp.]